MRRTGLMLAAMAFALLLVVGAASAADLGRVQAESATSLSGYGGTKFHEAAATGQSGTTPNALRYETNGGPPAYTLTVGPGEQASAVVVRSRVPATNDSAVGINVVVDGQAQAAKSIGRTATSYVERSWPVPLSPGQHTVRVVGSGLTSAADDLITDYVRLEGTTAPAPDADLDGVPDSQDVQGHGGYDDALTHESMKELTDFVAWGRGEPLYVGEFGWPQNTTNTRNYSDDSDPSTENDQGQWNALAETWFRRADKEGLNVTAHEASERQANNPDGGYYASIYMQCGNTDCPGFRTGEKPLALTKEGFQAQVLERHLDTPGYFRGLNFSGGQKWERGIFTNANPGVYGDNFPDDDYFYPTTQEPRLHDGMNSFQYLKSQGITTVRLGFRWERVQPTLNGPLNEAEMVKIDEAIANADAAGLKVVLDMHNYGGYWNATTGGHDGLGKLALGSDNLDSPEFTDVWKRLSGRYANSNAVAMYDLMNEPSGTDGIVPDTGKTEGQTWERLTTDVVNAIRARGDNTTILVPSFEAGVGSTPQAHPNGPWITNQPNLLWGAHQYMDSAQRTADGQAAGGGKYVRHYDQEDAISEGKGF